MFARTGSIMHAIRPRELIFPGASTVARAQCSTVTSRIFSDPMLISGTVAGADEVAHDARDGI